LQRGLALPRRNKRCPSTRAPQSPASLPRPTPRAAAEPGGKRSLACESEAVGSQASMARFSPPRFRSLFIGCERFKAIFVVAFMKNTRFDLKYSPQKHVLERFQLSLFYLL